MPALHLHLHLTACLGPQRILLLPIRYDTTRGNVAHDDAVCCRSRICGKCQVAEVIIPVTCPKALMSLSAMIFPKIRSRNYPRLLKWRTLQGESVCEHLADRFIAMEQQLSQSRPDYLVPPMSATRSGKRDRAV